MHKLVVLFAITVGLIAAVACAQVAPVDQDSQGDMEATVSAGIADTLGSSSLNSTWIAEMQTVQSALDLWMAESGSWPEPQIEPVDDLTATDPALSPTYMRKSITECKYTWDAQGRVTQHC